MSLRCAARWAAQAAHAAHAALVLLVPASATLAAPAAERYLVIGASEPLPGPIARRAAALAEGAAAGDGAGLVLTTADCGAARTMYAWAAAVADSAEAAQEALERLRQRVPDAYLLRCVPRPGSLLALGIPAVDASIAGVPADAVNWRDADRITSVASLGPADAPTRLVLVRQYVAQRDDPLEGRRTRVLLLPPGGVPQPLLDDCIGASGAVLAQGWLALQCDSEQAADNILHTVHAFTAAGQPVTEAPRCRAPRIGADNTLLCQGEAVDAQGRLQLAPRRVPLARP